MAATLRPARVGAADNRTVRNSQSSHILADEPTGNLDPETSASIMDFLVELNGEGRTIVMVTHDLQVAGRAKRALRLVNGSIQADGHAQPLPAAVAYTEQEKALSTN